MEKYHLKEMQGLKEKFESNQQARQSVLYPTGGLNNLIPQRINTPSFKSGINAPKQHGNFNFSGNHGNHL